MQPASEDRPLSQPKGAAPRRVLPARPPGAPRAPRAGRYTLARHECRWAWPAVPRRRHRRWKRRRACPRRPFRRAEWDGVGGFLVSVAGAVGQREASATGQEAWPQSLHAEQDLTWSAVRSDTCPTRASFPAEALSIRLQGRGSCSQHAAGQAGGAPNPHRFM